MLKWFRKYNKYILAVGISLLMVAFLIQGTLGMFMPSPTDQPVGHIGDVTITVGEQRSAGAELQVLEALSPMFSGAAPEGAMQWLLMTRESQSLGLSASQFEVHQLLQQLNGLKLLQADVGAVVARLQRSGATVTEPFVLEAVRHWLMNMQLLELVNGLGHLSADERLEARLMAIQAYQQHRQFGGMSGFGRFVSAAMDRTQGQPRISEPLVKHYLHEQYATVEIEAVPVSADKYLDKIEPPTPQYLASLFDQYKDKLPGQSEPYGIGFRLSDRVKVEYLALPIDRLRDKASVDEADVYTYYEQNREQFKNLPKKPAPPEEKKDEAKEATTPDAKPDAKPDASPDAKPDPKPQKKPEPAKPDAAKDEKKDGPPEPAPDQPGSRKPPEAPEPADTPKAADEPKPDAPKAEAPPAEPVNPLAVPQNPFDAAAPVPAPVTYKPYEEVADEVRDRLRSKAAQELADQMLREAAAIFLENARSLKQDGGFRVTKAEGWAPVPLEEVATKLEAQFGVRPDVKIIDRWLDRKALGELPGIGNAFVPGGQMFLSFPDYTMTVRELHEGEDTSALPPLYLQTNLPSQPMSGLDRSRYLFRVMDVSKEHVPASLDEVREQVTASARRLTAYEKLLADYSTLVSQVRALKLKGLAEAYKSTVLKPPPIPRRTPGSSGNLEPPFIEGVGRSEQFVDKLFQVAQRLSKQGNIKDQPPDDRVAPLSDDRTMTVFVTRIDGYESMTRSDYVSVAGGPFVGSWVKQATIADRVKKDPMSIDGISKRIGFKFEHRGDDQEEKDKKNDADAADKRQASAEE